MPGPLKDARREKFAQGLATGKLTQLEAYVAAGYRPNDSHATRTAQRGDVRERVAEIQARAAVRAEITAADIARQLDSDRKFARRQKQAAAAVSATMGKAKVLGLIIDRSRVTVDLSHATDEELEVLERVLARSPNTQ